MYNWHMINDRTFECTHNLVKNFMDLLNKKKSRLKLLGLEIVESYS